MEEGEESCEFIITAMVLKLTTDSEATENKEDYKSLDFSFPSSGVTTIKIFLY